MNGVGWTDERMTLLRDLVAQGLTSSALAAALGVTRNAVLGKCHRHGISVGGGKPAPRPTPKSGPRVSKSVAPPRPRAPARPPAPRPTAIVAQVPVLRVAAPAAAVGLLDLRFGQCRFPLGGSRARAVLFCGAPALTGRSYCEDHHSLCHRARGVAEEEREAA